MCFSRRNNQLFRSLWGTATLRLALIFSLIFGLGAALLVGVVDYGLFRMAQSEVRTGLRHQMDIMIADAKRVGAPALVDLLEAQDRNREARRYLFLVLASDGQSFSNGLTRQAVNDEGFRHNLATKGRSSRWPDQRPNMLVLSHTMDDGTLLAVGRDTQHLDELRSGIRNYALWGGLGIIALALLAGLTTGYLFLRRLEHVNQAVDHIVSGHSAQRLPAIGFGREFDQLANQLNHMLDRQEAAMDALRNVSEGIAHELRTPLGRLRNRLEEMDRFPPADDRHSAQIDKALEEMDQINALFDSLLTLARIEAGQSTSANVEEVAPARLIRQVGEIYQPVVEEAGGTLQVTILPQTTQGHIHGDSGLLLRALSNLIENALVHSAPAAPHITLSLTQDETFLYLSVADNGPGIPAHEREQVVRRFYRLKHSQSRPGSGLGLAMCAAVAHWHKGKLILEDNHPGLIATLRLPHAEK